MLEHDNDDLQQQLILENDNADGLEQETEEQRIKLASAQEEIKRQETQLRLQTRELNNIKVRWFLSIARLC